MQHTRTHSYSHAHAHIHARMQTIADHIAPFVAMIREVYAAATLLALGDAGMKDTLTALAQRFDAEVGKVLLRFTYGYVQKLLSGDGADALKARLQSLDDTSDDTKLYNATDSKYQKEGEADAAYRSAGAARAAAVQTAYPNGKRQPCSTLLEMMVFASADEASFKAAVTTLGEAVGAEVRLSERKGSSLKGMLRLYEKGLLKAVILGLDFVDFSLVFDVLRAMLVAPTTEVAAKAQAAVYDGKELPPCRSKCRLVGESVTGWRDELVNVIHATGKHGLVGEIQIVRENMLLQREHMGGHDGYDESRSLRGLFEACVASGYGGKKLSKSEQKKMAKIEKGRKKAIAKKKKADAAFDALMAKFDLQEQAIMAMDAKP